MSETTNENIVQSQTIIVNPKTIELENKVKELEGRLSQSIGFRDQLEYQQYIENPPVNSPTDLYTQACRNDGVTIKSWLETWIKYIKENNRKYNLNESSAMQEHAKFANRPAIICGAGPSLKYNVDVLAREKGDIPVVACLHAFAFLEDNGVHADYYVNLDSGPITIEEMSQGGKYPAEHYWELSKERTLITAVTGNPELHEKWRGKKLFFAVMASSPEYVKAYNEETDFGLYFSVGGNTLGAALYFAKAILGCNPIAFVGADFSFGYDKKFHSWDSPYDKQYNGLIKAVDVFGNKVGTWPSYYNFKNWFEYVACGGQGNQPGMYYNCTEGGILGSYFEGNIKQITQMRLKDFFWCYNLHKRMPEMVENKINGTKLLF